MFNLVIFYATGARADHADIDAERLASLLSSLRSPDCYKVTRV